MRGIIYDVYCTTDRGEHIIVEMQNRDQAYFIDRTLFYMAKAITGQGTRGNWNYNLKAVYGIFFMNFKASELADDKFRTDVVLADMKTHDILTGKMRMIYLQLPHFNKSEKECITLFDCFIYTLKNMEILDRMPFIARNAVFKRLAEIADVNTLSKEEHDKYDESIKILRDNIVVHQAAIRDGLMKGMEKGLQQGLQQGMEKGMEKGRNEEKLETAKRMKQLGLDINTIMQITSLTADEISNL